MKQRSRYTPRCAHKEYPRQNYAREARFLVGKCVITLIGTSSAYSQYLRKTGMKLGEFVRLLRGQTYADSRPNKALEVPTHPSWSSYKHKNRWASIVKNGVIPEWLSAFDNQSTHPKNHASAARAINIVVKIFAKSKTTISIWCSTWICLPSWMASSAVPLGPSRSAKLR